MGKKLINEWNQFLGFRTELNLPEKKYVHFDIAARSYYRLYINNEMRAHGPARTAHGYLRVDSFGLWLGGTVSVAIEVASYDKPDKYSNSVTLEPGIFIAELSIDDEVISATGSESCCPWRYQELVYRQSEVEYMSHSREFIEVYDLKLNSFDWYSAKLETLNKPLLVEGRSAGIFDQKSTLSEI